MPRASRYFLPGHVWHITHRCHKQEFLLKFAFDRRAWVQWLFEARKRYGLSVLNYIVTSNHIHLHIHLLVMDTGRGEVAKSMQLVAGRVAQEYNRRKSRKGAFWEDRYHATAVAADHHLVRCLTYVDLNMVRAGVVSDPSEWAESGYVEMMHPRQRYRVLDHDTLLALLGMPDTMAIQSARRAWVEESLRLGALEKECCWSDGLAVGDENFVKSVKLDLKHVGRNREVQSGGHGWVLRETEADYGILPPKWPV